MLKSIGFWNPETLSKDKSAKKLHDSNRHWAQQKYQQLPNHWTRWEICTTICKWNKRFNIHVEEHGLPLLMMLHGGFGFGQKFEGMHPFFSIFWQFQVLKQWQFHPNYGKIINNCSGIMKSWDVFSTARNFLKQMKKKKSVKQAAVPG